MNFKKGLYRNNYISSTNIHFITFLELLNYTISFTIACDLKLTYIQLHFITQM